MIRSMTGYGSAAIETPTLQAAVTVRTVNHRYLDIGIRLSRNVAALEPAVKEAVRARASREELMNAFERAEAALPCASR